MPAHKKDKTGMKFGKLKVLYQVKKNKILCWECMCECGVMVTLSDEDLSEGAVSCGICPSKKKAKYLLYKGKMMQDFVIAGRHEIPVKVLRERLLSMSLEEALGVSHEKVIEARGPLSEATTEGIIKALLSKKYTQLEIAKSFKVGRNTVSRLYKKLKESEGKKVGTHTGWACMSETMRQIRPYIVKGELSPEEIATKFEIGLNTLYRYAYYILSGRLKEKKIALPEEIHQEKVVTYLASERKIIRTERDKKRYKDKKAEKIASGV